MKKLLTILLCITFIFTTVCFSADASQVQPTITVSDAIGTNGGNIDVQISIADNPGILAMAFCVSYDNTALEYTGYTKGYLSNYNVMDHNDKGIVSFVSVEEEDISLSGTIITLNFKIKDTAAFGEYPITVLNNNPDKYGAELHNSFADSSEQFIVPTVKNGIVTIVDEIPTMPGDVNDDGAIDNKDYALLMQYLNGWSVQIVSENADVNGDRAIDNKDYALLMQYLNGWDVELKYI